MVLAWCLCLIENLEKSDHVLVSWLVGKSKDCEDWNEARKKTGPVNLSITQLLRKNRGRLIRQELFGENGA